MRDMRAQKGRGVLGEPGVNHVLWIRPWGKEVFGENII
jgi:hypothetical protein